jgi:hypothetical protein
VLCACGAEGELVGFEAGVLRGGGRLHLRFSLVGDVCPTTHTHEPAFRKNINRHFAKIC